MKRIAVVTTGGDAPGMNAAIRGVVRIGCSKKFQILGFRRGWEGLITNTCTHLTPRSVGGILQLGGTILHTSRCPDFEKKEGIRKATETLASNHVDGLVVIGGNGSFKGALELGAYTDTMIVGIPASIDNDVFGTDETIGFDTAANTAVAEIDKIRDTAVSQERVFIIEVMGRERGFLALEIGLTVGAEIILVPEVKYQTKNLYEAIRENMAKGKKSGLIVAAEGIGDTRLLAGQIQRNTKAEVRLSIIGYAQRGGNPTARSRLLASLFAQKAIQLLSRKEGGRVVGLQDGKIGSVELQKSCNTDKVLDPALLRLAKLLAT
ncbi:MAG TPA: ATP-dependent 6-phosphofructokinase [Candidatus Acidoferrales bacterium]|nr:ATP-dependent 6-phosphofructokinase [Candidatus Acidoferrales bacterium]